MVFNLGNEADIQQFREYGAHLLKKGCVVEMKEKKRQRSLSQNSYLHFVLGYFASEFGYGLEEVKYDIFKKTVNREIFGRERENKRGKKVVYMRSTTDLDTGEMTTAIERFRNYSSAVAGLYIPEPNEEEAYLEAMKQISMYEKYM